ncbi:hypothetical protein [Mycobacterium sp. CnD-18-1]|uniref:hypothetical protein n=1 Tax=Mycobacterium sp. CnD-18-1 TaxID=2917744 RepID=UPI001EF1A650|nr:hypothetical protein [Mycobacterium sp. CnD-18-1]MCG7607075.1 hypothetical protein [Mycobacterium sp. CnD-18-1]
MNTAADGILQIDVWPAYVGLGSTSPTTGLPDEPSDHPGYERGQITWAMIDGRIEGHARVFLPAGGYDHLVYAMHPTSALASRGTVKLPHPVILEQDGWLDVAPITHGTQAEGIK